MSGTIGTSRSGPKKLVYVPREGAVRVTVWSRQPSDELERVRELVPRRMGRSSLVVEED